MTTRKEATRKKLLSILPRAMLEELSGIERPWNADRATLTVNALVRWDHDEISIEINRLIEGAKD